MKKWALIFVAVSSLVLAGRAAEPEVSLLESNVLCVRVGQLPENFAKQLRAAEPTNLIAGIVLDLRFADGAATGDAAGYFASKKTPLVILVNSQTRGAAAVLVAQLRAATAAIVIGSTNPPGKILPDIAVSESAADEEKFQENPFAQSSTNAPGALSATSNLLAFVDHTSEAELVRKHVKDGEEDGDFATPRAAPPQPVIADPALARAVDLLKALAILHKSRG